MVFFDKFRKKKEENKENLEIEKMVDFVAKKIEYYSADNRYSKESIEDFKETCKVALNNLKTYYNSYLNAEESKKKDWLYAYNEQIKQIEFMRPNTNEEIEERNRIANTFSENLLEIVGNNSRLRFHGSPIYFARDIIKTKSISGTADRYDGYIKSTDIKGEFSASTIESLSRTINYFTDFASYNRCLPCGVLFVLKEKEGDEEIRKYSTMQNVNFDANPEQLVSIISTEENINSLIKWCNEVGLDSSIVQSYDSCLDYFRNMNKSL